MLCSIVVPQTVSTVGVLAVYLLNWCSLARFVVLCDDQLLLLYTVLGEVRVAPVYTKCSEI